MGPFHIGVRTTTRDADTRLREALAAYLVDDVQAPPAYSVRVQDGDDHGGTRAFHALYHGRCALVRTRSRERLLRATRTALGVHLVANRAGGLLPLRQLALVGPTGAVLAPPELLPRIERGEQELAELGIHLLDPPLVWLDPATGQLEEVPLTGTATADNSAAVAAGESSPAAPVRPHPVRGWGLRRQGEEPPDAQEALVALLPHVATGTGRSPAALLPAVTGLLGRVPLVPLATGSVGELRERVLPLLT